MTTVPGPRLRPSALLAWRSPGRLQVGLGTGAVVLEGLAPVDELLVDALDGTTDLASLRRIAAARGGEPGRADALLHALADAGALVGAGREHEHEHERGGAAVVVAGASPTGLAVALGLACAGVGAVVAEDDAPLTAADTGPGAHPLAAVGLTRGESAARQVERLGRGTRCRARGPDPLRPDVVVVIASGAHDARRSDALVREGVTHLGVLLHGEGASVGPLVRPGSSTCLRCLDLHRADRDPEWPRVAQQLSGPSGGPLRPEPRALAALAGALAVQQVLAHLDGAAEPASLDATVEVDGGAVGVRPWSPHPRCGCTWADGG